MAYGWQQQAMEENARHISDNGRALYEAVRKLADRFDTLGTRLRSSLEAYNDAIGSLEGNVLVKAHAASRISSRQRRLEIKSLEPIDQAVCRAMLSRRRSADGLPAPSEEEIEA